MVDRDSRQAPRSPSSRFRAPVSTARRSGIDGPRSRSGASMARGLASTARARAPAWARHALPEVEAIRVAEPGRTRGSGRRPRARRVIARTWGRARIRRCQAGHTEVRRSGTRLRIGLRAPVRHALLRAPKRILRLARALWRRPGPAPSACPVLAPSAPRSAPRSAPAPVFEGERRHPPVDRRLRLRTGAERRGRRLLRSSR